MSEHTTGPANDRHQDVEVPGVEEERATHTGHSRRIFLAGAGAGVLGAAAVAGTLTAVPAAAQTAGVVEADDAGTSADVVVAYISDGRRGEITLYRGGHEVVVQDGNLARALTSHVDEALARSTNQEI